MSIAQLIDPITGQDGVVTLAQAGDWMQGRTLYGGASALVAFTHVLRKFTDLPPLRSAQIGFVAPIGEEIELEADIVRQGRNVTQISSRILCEGKVALNGFWLFGSEREANAKCASNPPGDFPPPPHNTAAWMPDQAPRFVKNNFDVRYGQTQGDDHGATVRRWARLIEEHQLDPVSQLVLMGDVMPPGAMRIMQRAGPISSINWSFNVLEPHPDTEDGWFLAENSSQHADHGYSSERLRMWDIQGRQVLDGLQCVAIFG